MERRRAMTLEQMRYVVAISQYGSITAAAESLFMAQPSLSRAVKELEQELGITVLERSRRGTSFTAEGLKLLEYAFQILEQTDRCREYFQNLNTAQNVLSLRISMHHYIFPVDALINAINRLGDSASYIFSVRECQTSQILNDVLTQQSQLGILFVSEVTKNFMERMFAQKGLEFHPLATFRPHAYLSCRHPLARETALSLKQLEPYPYVCYEQTEKSQYYSEEFVIPQSRERQIFVTDRSTMLSVIKNTNAYNIGSGCLLPHIISPGIITIPLAESMAGVQIGWIKLKNVKFSQETLDYLSQMLESLKSVIQ